MSNEVNGIDVDQMDSFARDSRCTGVKNAVNQERIIRTARVKPYLDDNEIKVAEWCYCSPGKSLPAPTMKNECHKCHKLQTRICFPLKVYNLKKLIY